ncbi:MAG: hypothetical protein KBS65_03920 [Prevotella sp.]|nr:hypothetical protein [Candidatus Equicola stercoris]
MSNRKYIIPEDKSQVAGEPVVNSGFTIPVTVPTMGGYTMKRLKDELTQIAMHLVTQNQEDETLMSWAELDAKIKRGVEDYKNGRVVRKLQTESAEDFLERLCTM